MLVSVLGMLVLAGIYPRGRFTATIACNMHTTVQDQVFLGMQYILNISLILSDSVAPHAYSSLAQIDNVAVICQRAQEHIHAGECILTYGYSKIVEQFLKAAGAKRKFQVLLAVSICVARTKRLSE
jgi:hypothetical protein